MGARRPDRPPLDRWTPDFSQLRSEPFRPMPPLRCLQICTAAAALFAILGACGVPATRPPGTRVIVRPRPPRAEVTIRSLTGTWVAVWQTPDAVETLTLSIVQRGDALSGTLVVQGRSVGERPGATWRSRASARPAAPRHRRRSSRPVFGQARRKCRRPASLDLDVTGDRQPVGNWSGTVNFGGNDNRVSTMSLVQAGGVISGTLTMAPGSTAGPIPRSWGIDSNGAIEIRWKVDPFLDFTMRGQMDPTGTAFPAGLSGPGSPASRSSSTSAEPSTWRQRWRRLIARCPTVCSAPSPRRSLAPGRAGQVVR